MEPSGRNVATGGKWEDPENRSDKPFRNRWQPTEGKEGVEGSGPSPARATRKYTASTSSVSATHRDA